MQIKSRKEIDEGLVFLKQADSKFHALLDKCEEIPLRLEKPGFAGLSRIIIAQQVSRASAQAITKRFEETVLPLNPQRFLELGETAWIEIGLSRAKQKALQNLSEMVLAGELDLENICKLDAQSAIARLIAIKGIGPWTAEVYLLFCAGHPDIFPTGDIALQEAVRVAFNMDKRPDEKHLKKIAQTWSPWRGIAARVFWAYYSYLKDGKDGMPV